MLGRTEAAAAAANAFRNQMEQHQAAMEARMRFLGSLPP
eukprot:SAG11_NODE_8685_length_987_cov_1.393018_1_plen_38_part_10